MNDAADCQLRFRNEMLPEHGGALVSLQFADSCSRSEFIDQVRSCCKSPLGRQVPVVRSGPSPMSLSSDVSAPVQVRDDNMVRFAVTSVGRYGVRRSRTIYVDPSDKRMYIVRPRKRYLPLERYLLIPEHSQRTCPLQYPLLISSMLRDRRQTNAGLRSGSRRRTPSK